MGRQKDRGRRLGVLATAQLDRAPLLAELRALYTKVDHALAGWTCDSSTECCRFRVTGREPYPTAVEVAELERAVRARGGMPKRRSLPLAGRDGKSDDGRCSLLSDEGRCVAYASRPFGCRTFFCERARGPLSERADSGLPREVIAEVGREIVALSERFAPGEAALPRPLSRVVRSW